MAIRWRKKDEIELKNYIKKYNSKINRELKKGTEKELLPEKLSFKNLKNRIVDRVDYKREISLITDFTKRDSMKIEKTNRGGQIPLWLKRQTETKLKQINKVRRKQRKIYESLPVTDRGEEISKQNEFFKDNNLSRFNDKKVSWENKSKKDIIAFKESLKEYDVTKQEKDKLYRENYYKSVENGYSPEQAKKLKKLLDEIDTDYIVTKYYTDINMNINFNYDESDRDIRYQEIINAWKKVKKIQDKDKKKLKK